LSACGGGRFFALPFSARGAGLVPEKELERERLRFLPQGVRALLVFFSMFFFQAAQAFGYILVAYLFHHSGM
jgi:hypothetical protein